METRTNLAKSRGRKEGMTRRVQQKGEPQLAGSEKREKLHQRRRDLKPSGMGVKGGKKNAGKQLGRSHLPARFHSKTRKLWGLMHRDLKGGKEEKKKKWSNRGLKRKKLSDVNNEERNAYLGAPWEIA